MSSGDATLVITDVEPPAEPPPPYSDADSCNIYLEEGQRDEMVQACKCAATVHAACLVQWINTRSVAHEEDRYVCEICTVKYSVKVRQSVRWSASTCSSASWTQYNACLMMAMVFAMMIYVFWVYVNSHEYEESDPNSHWLLWVLSVAMILLFMSTMKTIYQRYVQL